MRWLNLTLDLLFRFCRLGVFNEALRKVDGNLLLEFDDFRESGRPVCIAIKALKFSGNSSRTTAQALHPDNFSNESFQNGTAKQLRHVLCAFWRR